MVAQFYYSESQFVCSLFHYPKIQQIKVDKDLAAWSGDSKGKWSTTKRGIKTFTIRAFYESFVNYVTQNIWKIILESLETL